MCKPNLFTLMLLVQPYSVADYYTNEYSQMRTLFMVLTFISHLPWAIEQTRIPYPLKMFEI